ncbi:MAG: trypsin-like peptidase domain-containing protein [Lachnospiraceae bacterium]|nr:trypsin-like peptidase domain-containing protein [Lachnospiraceae bacterium]
MKKIAKLVAGGAVFGLVAGSVFQGVEWTGRYAENYLFGATETVAESNNEPARLAATSVVSGANASGTSDVSAIAEQVLPSIVAIDVTEEGYYNTPFGISPQESTGSASGIIIAEKDNRLYIATNNHVVEGATKVTIRFNDDSTAEAEIKGTDSATDLAVVMVDMSKLSADTLKNIKVAAVGDSEATKVGEQAIAIGNALGYGTSVTVGYVSAKDREIGSEDGENVLLIQTDAAINPGNSGGALVNSRGEVIGINSSKFASEEVEGMGFAIPMAAAEPILESLMNQEAVEESERAYLGITGQDVDSEVSEAYDIPQGIYITEVTEGSPAEKAGLKKGNVIVEINGQKVTTLSQLQEKLSRCRAGDKGTITVKAGAGGSYEEKTLEITFGKKEDSAR